jgi:putative transposase
MPNYRRVKTPGGTFFFTVNLLERRKRLLVEHIDILREAFRIAGRSRPFRIIAIVVLPDHLHCIWQLPEGDADNARRWASIKSAFSRRLPCTERRSAVRCKRRERGIWQRRFWERIMQNYADLDAHIAYIHDNPVKHGLVADAVDWPYSSLNAKKPCGTSTPARRTRVRPIN